MARKRWVIALVLFLIVAVVISGCAFFRRPETRNNDNKENVEAEDTNFEVMSFYEKGWSQLTDGYPALESHFSDITLFMPFWYAVNDDGSVTEMDNNIEDQVVSFLAGKDKGQVMPLVVNRSGSDVMLLDPDIRSEAVKNLADLVASEEYTGVTIDFEMLSPDDRDGLTAFMSELYDRLKSENRALAVTVFPKVDVTEDVSGAYDYAALQDSVDYFIIMTYDRHEETSGPGSVSPADWVESNIKYALDQGVPRDKLVITLAAYGFDWPEGDRGEYLGLREILSRAQDVGANVQWDDAAQSPFFTYDDNNGVTHQVWFENGSSAVQRIRIAKNYKIRGVALWRMGFENEDYWTKMLQAAKQKVQ